MKRSATANEPLGARLRALDEAPPANEDTLFASIDAQRGTLDRAANLWAYYRKRLVVGLCLLAALGAGSYAWWSTARPVAGDNLGHFPVAPNGFRTGPAPEASTAIVLVPAPAGTPASGPATTAPPRGTAQSVRSPYSLRSNSRIVQKPNPPTPRVAAASSVVTAAASSDKATPATPLPVRPRARALATLPLTTSYLPVIGDPKVDCAKFRAPATWHTQVEVLAGPQLSVRSLRARWAEDAGYADSRRQSERPWYSATTQVRVAVRSSRGWVFRTGLSLTDQHERFDYAGNATERIQIETVYDPNGTPIRTDTIRELGRRVVSWHNRQRRLDVPLLAGYGWQTHPFDLHVNAGVLLNLWNRPTGRHLNAGGEVVSDWTEFRPQLLPELYLSLGINYRFAHRWTVQLEPHARYGWASVTTATAPLQRHYGAVGLLTGLRYQF